MIHAQNTDTRENLVDPPAGAAIEFASSSFRFCSSKTGVVAHTVFLASIVRECNRGKTMHIEPPCNNDDSFHFRISMKRSKIMILTRSIRLKRYEDPKCFSQDSELVSQFSVSSAQNTVAGDIHLALSSERQHEHTPDEIRSDFGFHLSLASDHRIVSKSCLLSR